jgi:hypothetical protein
VASLRRFWFPLPEHFGIGVTAPTEAQARALAEQARVALWPESAPLGAAVSDVDIRTLDQDHVVPNMEAPVWAGVWYPGGFTELQP